MSVQTTTTSQAVLDYTAMTGSQRLTFMSGFDLRVISAMTELTSCTDPTELAERTANVKSIFAVKAELMAVPAKAAAAKVPVDHEMVLAQRVVNLRFAADQIESGQVTPDGIDPATIDLARISFLVNVSGLVPNEASVKLAVTKITRSGQSHKIQDVFARAFEGLDSGSILTVTEIQAGGTIKADKENGIEEYVPSTGAISMRLNPGTVKGCTLVGYTAIPETSTSVWSASKN
jgi:hypothetical protein